VCEVNIGYALSWEGSRTKLIESIENSFDALQKEIEPKEWL
jgi:hypothetical protein